MNFEENTLAKVIHILSSHHTLLESLAATENDPQRQARTRLLEKSFFELAAVSTNYAADPLPTSAESEIRNLPMFQFLAALDGYSTHKYLDADLRLFLREASRRFRATKAVEKAVEPEPVLR